MTTRPATNGNVIDLDAFRQRRAARTPTLETTLVLPVWFCWAPAWAVGWPMWRVI